MSPNSTAPLVEDDVVGGLDAPGRLIVHSVGLGTLGVADKDAMEAAIVEFAQLPQVACVGDAAEDAQVRHGRRAPMPGLVGCYALQ